MTTANLLRDAITATKVNQRQYACRLFLKLVAEEPTHELAWVWLSGLLESREEQIKALENAIIISKGGPNIEARLHRLSQPGFGPEQAKFRTAVKAAKDGHRDQARTLLQQVVAENDEYEEAWMLLSQLAGSHQEQVAALENVLRINPGHIKAQTVLPKVKYLLYKNHLSLAEAYQEQEEFKKAVESFKLAEKYAPGGSYRAAAQQRWKMIQERGQHIKVTTPTFTLIRLAVTPPLLFGLLILLQSGLNPLQISPLFCLGGLGVVVGSLLAAGSIHLPHHPIWTTILGQEGLTNVARRIRFRTLGYVVILIPFVFWLISAINRLRAMF